jgi:type IV pilus assembly protein PilP
MNWRQPWLWPRAYQYALFVVAGVFGVLLLSPWWLHSWQAWDEASEAQAKLVTEQETTQTLRAQTAQLMQTRIQPASLLADASVLTQLAQKQGLQLSQWGLDKPQQSSALNALHMQEVPVHMKLQGSWDGWLKWLNQWPVSAPGVTLASLELKADPRGGISAQMLAVAPQSTMVESTFELSSVNLEGDTPADPFSASAWVHAQRAHIEQHPSYARLVAPELLRPRDLLETFPRERLQYVGQIASGSETEALVKVLPSVGGKKDTPMMSVHRVRVGSHLGQDFGKVLAVQPDHLLVQELALSQTGEWQTREVRLPLLEAAP